MAGHPTFFPSAFTKFLSKKHQIHVPLWNPSSLGARISIIFQCILGVSWLTLNCELHFNDCEVNANKLLNLGWLEGPKEPLHGFKNQPKVTVCWPHLVISLACAFPLVFPQTPNNLFIDLKPSTSSTKTKHSNLKYIYIYYFNQCPLSVWLRQSMLSPMLSSMFWKYPYVRNHVVVDVLEQAYGRNYVLNRSEPFWTVRR